MEDKTCTNRFYDRYLGLINRSFLIISVYTSSVFLILVVLRLADKLEWLNPGYTWFLNFEGIGNDALSNFYMINAQVLFVIFGVTLPFMIFILKRESGLSEVARQDIIKSMASLGCIGSLLFVFSMRGILLHSGWNDNASITLYFILSFTGGLILLFSICVPHYLFNQPSVCKKYLQKAITDDIIEITNEDLKMADEDFDLISNKTAREIYIRYEDHNSNKKKRKFERQDNGAKPNTCKFIQNDKIEVAIGDIIDGIDINEKYIELRIHWYPFKKLDKTIFIIAAALPLVYFWLWMSIFMGIIFGLFAGAIIIIIVFLTVIGCLYKLIIQKKKTRAD